MQISVLQLPQLFYSTEFSCRNTLRLSAVSYQHSLLERKVLLFFQRPSHSVRFFFCKFLSFHNQLFSFVEIAVFSVYSCQKAHMSPRCSRGFFRYFFGSSCPAPKMNSYTMPHGEILFLQLNNAMFIYFKMCPICKFFTIIVENIYIRFQSLVT